MRPLILCLLPLTMSWAANAQPTGCPDPVPLPSVPWDWGPTCVLVRADAPQAESVVARPEADILSSPDFQELGPFDGEAIFPLGFSPSGGFAWLSKTRFDDGGGWQLSTIDLHANSVQMLASWRVDDDLPALFSAHGTSIQDALAKHSIQLQAPEILSLPMEWNGARHSVDWQRESDTGGYSIWLGKTPGQRKRVGSVELLPCTLCGPHSERIIRNPLGGMHALILVHRTRRFESWLPEVTHTVLGAALTDRKQPPLPPTDGSPE